MNQEINHREQEYLSLDFSYMFRCLLKSVFVIIMCACIAGVGAYVFLDNYMKDTYTANINLAVIGRDNNSGRLADYSLSPAVTRNLNVLNSDMLREQMEKAKGVSDLSGTLTAERIGDTNLISMKASSDSAENSLRLLKAALNSYPTLSGYFESGYLIRRLTSLSADNILVEKARPSYYAVLAALLVFAAGVGMTVCFCLFSGRIHNREQAAAVLDMHILGSLHYIRKGREQKAILISDERTDISYVEEIDKIVTRIQGKMDKEHFKTLMINSIHENEGKSTIAVNVALNLARRGKRVMLIDADMRRPAVAKIFDYTLEAGRSLSDYLLGESPLQHVMYADERFYGLICIFQGKAVAEPDKLLEDSDFRTFIEKVSKRMDYVILDTPPIGIVRDSEIIAGIADAAAVIIRQDDVRAAEVNDVVDLLDDAGVSILGGILNMVKGEGNSSGHGKRYGKYYYGYDKQQ